MLLRMLQTATLWLQVELVWNLMAHGDAREGKWRGNWRTEWVASTLHTNSEHGVSSITTAVAHISAASSRLNFRPCWFKWTRPFRRKTKCGFCACAITLQNAVYCRSYRVTSVVTAVQQSSQRWSENQIQLIKKQKLHARTHVVHPDSTQCR